MTQEINRPRVVIDTNKHGIRRETNLDAEYKAYIKRKQYENRPKKSWKKKIEE